MSISAPRYLGPPIVQLGRAYRTLAIVRRELLRRSTWGTWLAVGLTYLTVTANVALTVYFASLLGRSTLAAFESPFEMVFWTLLILIVAAAVGAGSIADDLGSRAITLYLSRPIRLVDYLLAKAAATGIWILVATLGPGLVGVGLLAALGVVSASIAIQATGGFLAVAFTATVFFTGVSLAFSSLTRRSLYAGVTIFGVVLSLATSGEVISGITGNASVLYADPVTNLHSVAQAAFGLSGPYPTDPVASATLLLLTGILLAALAWWRLSRIEVVGE